MTYITKYITWILLAVSLLWSTTACESVLDVSPKGVLAEGVSSAETVDKLVIAAYQALGAHFFGNDEAFAGPGSNWVIDAMSDDAYKGGGGIGDRQDIHQLETFTLDPTSYPAAQKWRNNYFGIARCNLAIREIQALEDPTYPKDQRIGELRFLRGYFHFDLKRNFNQIVYLNEETDPATASNTQFTSEELYDLILGDFQNAFDVLPITQDEIGRVNKYAAAAYLAKVNLDLGRWDDVLTWVAEVKKGPFSLQAEFASLSELDFENGPEVVFTIQYSIANLFANHDWSNLLNVTLGPGIAGGAYANGDDFYLGSQNLVNSFRTGSDGLPLFDTYNEVDVVTGSFSGTLDPRLDHTVGRIGIPWKGTALYGDAWVRSPDYYPGFSCKKHVIAPDDPRVHNSFPWAASGLNFALVRYAEVLLWEAEALIENNQVSQGIALINQVRERAKNSTPVQTLDGTRDAANYLIELYPTNLSQTDARQALRFERRLELALEGHRWYDLRRWGILEQTISTYLIEENDNVPYLNGVTFTSNKHEYLPIPQSEIDLAPAGTYSQNPNY